jgi:hypothetical protein
MKKYATILTALLAFGAASAQDAANEELAEEEPLRRYTVEVIIFSYEEDVSVGSEIFLPDEPPPVEDRLLDEDGNPILPDEEAEEEEQLTWVIAPPVSDEPVVDGDEAQEPNPFQLVLLTEDQFLLGDALRKFELLDAYETITHFGWTQPAFPEEETPPIELQLLTAAPEGLEGTFTLYLSRYLHLVIDLALDAPDAFEEEVIDDDDFFSFGDAQRQYGEEADALPVRFRIQDDRIFKNGDLRYFDHPKFGVLAKITRVEEPEEEDASGTLASSTR